MFITKIFSKKDTYLIIDEESIFNFVSMPNYEIRLT